MRIETARGRFEALVAGPQDGPLALVLHGFPDHPPSMAPLLERLAAAGYRGVAPWMRGYAPSTLEGPYDVESLAADLLALADALSPARKVALLGHDWGAAATYAACGLWPARFSAAVTMAVPHPLAFVAALRARPDQIARSWYMAFFQLRGLADHALAAHDFTLVDRLWRAWSPGYVPDPAAMRALKACLAASLPAPIAYYRAMLWPPRAALARLRRPPAGLLAIEVPTLHLCGHDDGCIGPAASRGQHRFFAGPFKSEQLMGVGHFLPLEAPDRVAALALDWLARHAKTVFRE